MGIRTDFYAWDRTHATDQEAWAAQVMHATDRCAGIVVRGDRLPEATETTNKGGQATGRRKVLATLAMLPPRFTAADLHRVRVLSPTRAKQWIYSRKKSGLIRPALPPVYGPNGRMAFYEVTPEARAEVEQARRATESAL